LATRKRSSDVDNGVNALQNVREVPSDEIVDDGYVHPISILDVGSFHRLKFSCPDQTKEKNRRRAVVRVEIAR
jgi:hypothetical protein